MHLGVIFGGGSGGGTFALLLFVALKTASDIGLDLVDRRMAEHAAQRTAHASG
jgi:hypothetical protein